MMDIFAVESTNIKPCFDKYPLGYRSYKLKDWEEFGCFDNKYSSLSTTY